MAALLRVVFAGHRQDDRSPLWVRIATNAPAPEDKTLFPDSALAAARRLEEVEARLAPTPLEAHLEPTLSHYRAVGPAPDAIQELEHRYPALQIEITMLELFAPGAPLEDPRVVRPSGHVAHGHPTVGDVRRAEAFLRRYLAEGPFPPSAAMADGTTWRLLFALKPLVGGGDEGAAWLQDLAEMLARLVHGAHAVHPAAWVTLPVGRSSPREAEPTARLVHLDPHRRYDPRRLHERLTAFLEADSAPEQAHSRGARAPTEMRTRTLPEGWALEDIDLPPRWRSFVAGEFAPGGILLLDGVKGLVRAMAAGGYSWEDVVLLIRDCRYGLSRHLRVGDESLASLRITFRRSVSERRTASPARVPYGLRRIGRIRDPEQRGPHRYVVEGGSRALPFRVVVSHDVLATGRLFRRALGGQVGRIPYAVVPEVWEAAIRRALLDPRVARPTRAPAEEPSLSALVHRFVGRAADWGDGAVGGEGDAALPWPLLRDGQVVFPLATLRTALAAAIPGPPPRLGEVTSLLRGLGGGPAGTMRFRRWGVIRVWALPGTLAATARGAASRGATW